MQHKLDELLSDGIDQIGGSWPYIKDKVTIAWNKSTRRPDGYYIRILGIETNRDFGMPGKSLPTLTKQPTEPAQHQCSIRPDPPTTP